jgi:predicted DNA-binding transcriptional regulator AlpA
MVEERLLRVEEVALLVGCAAKTINSWYQFKKLEPNNPYAKMLPDYEQATTKSTRYWKQSDIAKIVEFKNSIPHGCRGVLGKVTQPKKKEN